MKTLRTHSRFSMHLVCLLFVGACPPAICAEASRKDSQESVRVAGIVLKWLRMDKERNYQRGAKLIREAAKGGAKIVFTTEGFLDGFMNGDRTIPLSMYQSLAERIPQGKYYRQFSELAQELDIYLALGTAEFDKGRTYNTVALIGPDGKLIGKHRKTKMNEFEAIRDTPGSQATALETRYGRIGFRICYERHFPDLIGKTCDAGADFIVLVSGGSFGPENNRTVQARSRESERHMIFVHPTQFLVTAPDGSIALEENVGGFGTHPPEKHIMNDAVNTYAVQRGMLITTEQIGTKIDENRVVYFDMPLLIHR